MNLDLLLNLAIEASENASKEILAQEGNFKVWEKENKTPLTSADIAANEAIVRILGKSGLAICSEEEPLDYSVRENLEYFWLIDPLDGTKSFIEGSDNYCILIALIKQSRPILAVITKPRSGEIYYAHEQSKIYKNHSEIAVDFTCKNTILESPSPTILTPPSILMSGVKGCKMQDLEKSSKTQGLRCNKENLNSAPLIALVSKHHSSMLDNEFIAEHNFKPLSISAALKFVALITGEAQTYHRFENLHSWDIAAGDFLVNHSGGFMGDLYKNPINYNAPTFLCPAFIAVSDKKILNILNLSKYQSILYETKNHR